MVLKMDRGLPINSGENFLPKNKMTIQYIPYDYRKFAKGGVAAWSAGYGTNSRMSYRTSAPTRTTSTNKRRKPNRVTSFKSMMLKNTAAKHKTDGPGATMLHNSIYSLNVTSLITQGDTNQNRDGDAVNLEALKLRGFFNSNVTAGAYVMRILVGWSGEEYTTANFTTLGLGTAEIFLPSGANTVTSIVNPKAFTVLYDEVFDINSQIAATADVCSIVKTVPLNQKFNYQSDASTMGKTKNLYIVAVAFVVGGTGGVTGVGNIALATDLIFK